MILRRPRSLLQRALSGLLAIALVLAGIMGAQGHASEPLRHHHHSSHSSAALDATASDVAMLDVYADAQQSDSGAHHERGCGDHADCADLFCHGGMLLPPAFVDARGSVKAALNCPRAVPLAPLVVGSLERPPRTSSRA